jgi:hypothetical protein
MFGREAAPANLFGENRAQGNGNQIMSFQDELACAKCCPNLTMKQRYQIKISVN